MDLNNVCLDCLADDKLVPCAVYSKTQCAPHAEAAYASVLASATEEEWARAYRCFDAPEEKV